MPTRRFSVEKLQSQYRQTFFRSSQAYDSGCRYFPNGVSQFGRFYPPFPIFVKAAQGADLVTVDDLSLTDFWQGHFANILGHMRNNFANGLTNTEPQLNFQLGCNTEIEQQVAEELCRLTSSEQALFCTTGAQATMSAILIGLAHTRRRHVLKIQGGWHGVQPWSLVSVKSEDAPSLRAIESLGLPAEFVDSVVTVRFNDIQHLNDLFLKHGSQIGVVIAELVLGNSGMEMASPEFVSALRDNCNNFGAVLVFDEIVTGFRCGLGGLSSFYGVTADISTFGKAVAGGMPFSAIVGRQEILSSVNARNVPRVLADAGTFTSHPMTLKAVLRTLRELAANSSAIYPGIVQRAERMRGSLQALFNSRGVPVHVTGNSPASSIPGFPIMTVRFLLDRATYDYHRTLAHWDNAVVDVELRDVLSRQALCIRGFFIWQGAGVVTAAHSDDHINGFLDAYSDWLDTWN